MTHEEIIENMRNMVMKNRYTYEELEQDCNKYNIEMFDDVLHPIGYNTCDRCDKIGDSELDFFWIDGFDWDENDPKDRAILKDIAREGQDYCAVCWDCVKALERRGEREIKMDYKGRYERLSREYVISAKMYFRVLAIVLCKSRGKYYEASTEIAQKEITNDEWRIACNVLDAMYKIGKGE